MALPVPRATLRPGNVFETIVSGLVVVVAVAFLTFVYVRTGTGHIGSYAMHIRLADAGGLSVGSEVRLGGTKIGSVTGLSLDQSDFSAVVGVSIRDDLALPVDSQAAVSSSVFGDAYLAITPGHADVKIAPGGELEGMGAPRGRAKPRP